MGPLFTLQYWMALLPPPIITPLFLYLMLTVFGGLLAVGILMIVLSGKLSDRVFWAKAAPKLASLFGWMGAFGLIHVWVAYEQIYLIGARFWLLLWAGAFLIWLGLILKYILVNIPDEAAEFAEKKRIEKYIPKKR